MEIKRYFFLGLYYYFARFLPVSYSKMGGVFLHPSDTGVVSISLRKLDRM